MLIGSSRGLRLERATFRLIALGSLLLFYLSSINNLILPIPGTLVLTIIRVKQRVEDKHSEQRTGGEQRPP